MRARVEALNPERVLHPARRRGRPLEPGLRGPAVALAVAVLFWRRRRGAFLAAPGLGRGTCPQIAEFVSTDRTYIRQWVYGTDRPDHRARVSVCGRASSVGCSVDGYLGLVTIASGVHCFPVQQHGCGDATVERFPCGGDCGKRSRTVRPQSWGRRAPGPARPVPHPGAVREDHDRVDRGRLR